jgi:hypothetical protein
MLKDQFIRDAEQWDYGGTIMSTSQPRPSHARGNTLALDLAGLEATDTVRKKYFLRTAGGCWAKR